jgi:hypothetical protein
MKRNAMEYIENNPFADRLKLVARFPAYPIAVLIPHFQLREAATGLEFLHK